MNYIDYEYEREQAEWNALKDSINSTTILKIVAQNASRKWISYVCVPGLNFSAQNDVRVGLQWEDFLGKLS